MKEINILCVEDGSVDVESLENEGLHDGKVLIYRQGANPPFVLKLKTDDGELKSNQNKVAMETLERLKGIIVLNNSDEETGDMQYSVDTDCLFEDIDDLIWVDLCMQLENIEHSELINIATKKKILDLQSELEVYKRAVNKFKELYQKYCQLIRENEQLKSNQNKVAVEKLEELLKESSVKYHLCDSAGGKYKCSIYAVNDIYITEQIRELKGESDE